MIADLDAYTHLVWGLGVRVVDLGGDTHEAGAYIAAAWANLTVALTALRGEVGRG